MSARTGGVPERERIAAALRRVRRACAELTEAEQDFPPKFAALRQVVHAANESLGGMIDMVAEQHALDDELITRWLALKPRVEALGPDDALDDDDLREAITVARRMDAANDPGYDEARAWFKANQLPTTWGQAPPRTPQHRTTDRR
jgi:hypothetical protein